MNRYDVLGVKTDAAPEQIKSAYRKLAAKTHPDVAGDVMKPLFMSVQDAYETLSNQSKRAAYDREIGVSRPAPASESTGPRPADENRYEEADDSAAAASASASKKLARARIFRRIRIGVSIAVIAWLAAVWLFQDYNLWMLGQANDRPRLYIPRGVPAIVYVVLWALGALIAAVCDEFSDMIRGPLWSAGLAAVFAFITATGTPGEWFSAFGVGLALTAAIAVVARWGRD